jgi:hypothetical protein
MQIRCLIGPLGRQKDIQKAHACGHVPLLRDTKYFLTGNSFRPTHPKPFWCHLTVHCPGNLSVSTSREGKKYRCNEVPYLAEKCQFCTHYVKIDEGRCPDYLATGTTTFDFKRPVHVGLRQSAACGCTGQVIRSNG